MTTATTSRSAFPRAVTELVPHAQSLASELGTLPSRNKLMTTFNVGAKKANELLAELTTAPAGRPDLAPEPIANEAAKSPVTWPVLVLCLPAFVAIWGGWVEMGRLTGFGMVTLLPGIFDSFQINTAITLPIGVETYAAYALFVWLSGRAMGEARTFAKWSALASLLLGGLGQVAYHLMTAAGWTSAPWPITAAVSCIPVAVLGMGAALAHLMHRQ